MIVMKNLFKIVYVFMMCLCFTSIFPKPAEASSKNPDDVAKLQKFVDAQLKKGTKLPKYDVTWDNTHYEWDGNGNLKRIDWRGCNFIGSIKLPAFNKLETVFINESPGLKCFDAGVNPSLMRLDIVGGTPAYFKMDKTKSALKKLSVKKCKGLKVLYADWNSLTHIDLSGNKKLESLNLSGCKLRSLNLTNNKKITDLDVSYNKKLPRVNLKNCTYIKSLDISGNKFTRLDISKNIRLEGFDFNETKFTKIDLRRNKNLKRLSCYNGSLEGNGLLIGKNPNISVINCRRNKLTGLDTSGCANLVTLDCSNNSILNLDLSENKKLINLNCSKNTLEKLETRSLKKLMQLNCSNCNIKSLDLKNLKKLASLNCDRNNIKKLDISGLEYLEYLYCRNNLLKRLDLTKNKRLRELHCENNKIKKLNIRNCAVKKYLSFGDEFFSHDAGVVVVKRRKINRKG